MTFSFTQLLTPQGRTDIETELLSIAASVGLSTTSWQAGQPIRSFLALVAQKFADSTQTTIEIIKGGFGDLLSSDEWADQWALAGYNVQRVEALAATGAVNLTNTSVSTYTYAIGELIVAHDTTGQLYRNTSAISIAGGASLADVSIKADELGIVGNAAPGAITTVVSSAPGLLCTNPLSVLGADKETTPALVTRARAKFGALSPNGPKDAYNYVVTTPELCATSTPITRSKPVADTATGEVTVYIATAEGTPIPADVDIAQAAIDLWAEPWCTTATAVGATNNVIAITYHAWLQGTNLSEAQIEFAIEQALEAYFSTIPVGGFVIEPGGEVFVAALSQVIGTATPGVLRVNVTVPAADVSLLPSEVAVLGTIIPTITIL